MRFWSNNTNRKQWKCFRKASDNRHNNELRKKNCFATIVGYYWQVIRFSDITGAAALSTGAGSSILISLLSPKTENLIMSLRSDIISFWFWGYRGDLRIELQAHVHTGHSRVLDTCEANTGVSTNLYALLHCRLICVWHGCTCKL